MSAGDSQPFKLPDQPSHVQVHAGGIRIRQVVNNHLCDWSMTPEFAYNKLGTGDTCKTCPNQLNCVANPEMPYKISVTGGSVSFKFDASIGWTAEHV